jgi:catechol 2,3-dioxygenase-like lactoylglutathione lyase family enzyme
MLTRVDHVMICVPDLAAGIDAYRRLGFEVDAGGDHPGRGTHNALAVNEHDYLELLGVRDRAEYLRASPGGALLTFLERGGGMRFVAVQSDDLAADVAAMRARGVDVSGPVEGARRTPGGTELRWKAATLGARSALPIFFVEHLTPPAKRRRQFGRTHDHPNGVTRLDRVYVAVPDVAAAVEQYSTVLGQPTPDLQRGTVINADMAVFQLGETGLAVAQPAGSGPAGEMLARRGPGPFQALYRTRSMAGAVRWMTDHHLSPPARATRNTGESALLVPPDQACGVYLAFVGPA